MALTGGHSGFTAKSGWSFTGSLKIIFLGTFLHSSANLFCELRIGHYLSETIIAIDAKFLAGTGTEGSFRVNHVVDPLVLLSYFAELEAAGGAFDSAVHDDEVHYGITAVAILDFMDSLLLASTAVTP